MEHATVKSWESLVARIDALTLRERGFVIAGVLAVTYFSWTGFVMQPMDRKLAEVNGNHQRISAELTALNAQAQAALKRSQEDPNAVHREQLAALKQELDALNTQLSGTTDHLVPPAQMARVLEAVLQEAGGLQLQQVTSLGSSPLVPEKKKPAPRADTGTETGMEAESGADADHAVRKVYRHGVKLQLQGRFFDVLEFLRKLEGLDWKFFWDGIDFRVLDYPDAAVEITVFTISLEPDWIGS